MINFCVSNNRIWNCWSSDPCRNICICYSFVSWIISLSSTKISKCIKISTNSCVFRINIKINFIIKIPFFTSRKRFINSSMNIFSIIVFCIIYNNIIFKLLRTCSLLRNHSCPNFQFGRIRTCSLSFTRCFAHYMWTSTIIIIKRIMIKECYCHLIYPPFLQWRWISINPYNISSIWCWRLTSWNNKIFRIPTCFCFRNCFL